MAIVGLSDKSMLYLALCLLSVALIAHIIVGHGEK